MRSYPIMSALAGFAGVVVLLLVVGQQPAFADGPSHQTVSAQERSGGAVAEVAIRDDDLVGQRIVKATYALYDGYQKTVLIPHGGSALKAVDLANCHRAACLALPRGRAARYSMHRR